MKIKGFTLIELLIVVAIIAILAAIAVPNFLEAQTRAKVTRMKADMRAIGTAIEAYSIDNNGKYPFDWDSRGYNWYLTDVFSTPIAYISGPATFTDAFLIQNTNINNKRLRYINYPANMNPAWLPCPYPGPFTTSRWDPQDYTAASKIGLEFWGPWKLSSAGPDKQPNSGFFTADLNYDPSNGTVSGGDIIRSAKYASRTN